MDAFKMDGFVSQVTENFAHIVGSPLTALTRHGIMMQQQQEPRRHGEPLSCRCNL